MEFLWLLELGIGGFYRQHAALEILPVDSPETAVKMSICTDIKKRKIMNGLYAIKFKKKRVDGKIVDAGHWTTYSKQQICKTIAEKGIDQVESIRHDDKAPKNTRKLNGNEMLEFWKTVEVEK